MSSYYTYVEGEWFAEYDYVDNDLYYLLKEFTSDGRNEYIRFSLYAPRQTTKENCITQSAAVKTDIARVNFLEAEFMNIVDRMNNAK